VSSERPSNPNQPPKRDGFTPRALIIGLLLVFGFTLAGSLSVLTRYEIMGTGYLPRGVMALLLLLILANMLVGRLRRGMALTRKELLVIFILLAIMAAIPGQEFGQHVYLNLLGIVYYATPEIAPPGLYLESLSPYLLPSLDRQAPVIRWAYEGLPAGQGVPWGSWLVPLLVWTPFFLALYWLLLCFAALLSRRWEQQERLLYPLMQVPMELTDDRPRQAPLLSNPLLWAAFALACIPYLSKGLHSYFPTIPDLNLQKDSGALFGGGPLVAFNYMPLHFYPEMTGISYLLSGEVAFSLWFFYLVRMAQSAVRIGMGLNTNHAQFAEMQTAGGYLVLALALLWSARHYLSALARTCLTREAPDPAVSRTERLAFWGVLGAFGFILWWSTQIGLALSWATVLMGLFPLVSMVVSRVVCEAGMFIYASPFRLDQMLFRLIGVKRLGPTNLALMTMMSWTQIRGTATQFMPQAFQCFKLGSLIEAPRRKTILWLMGAVALAILASHVIVPSVIYNYGVFRLGWWPQGSGLGTTNRLVSELRGSSKTGLEDWVGLVTGGAFTFLLVQMRQRFVWWPFHPLGYVAWLGWPTERYWLSIFCGWLVKIVVVRFGGYQTFQRLKPIAYGLILGVTFIVTFWIVFHFFVPGTELIRE